MRPALVLLGVLAVTVALILAPIDYRALGNYGYLGVFAITLLATGAFVLPVPYLMSIIVAGSFLNPTLVAIVAGAAAAIGELTGYLVGYSGRSLLAKNRWTVLLEEWMVRFAGWVIFLGSVVPNPIFDAIGIIAGAARVKLSLFLIACFLGKSLRFWLLATLGESLLS